MTLDEYVSRGYKKVDGWFSRIDGELYRVLLNAQRANDFGGGVAEIGVHHGKAFIPLCLGLRDDERAYCIDIFERQELNLDVSGRGDRSIFEKSLQSHGISLDRVFIDARSSLAVKSDDILNAVGKIRFFSIDGGHWLEIVKNDLRLAEMCLSEYGIIALDDFYRAEWPDVTAAYFQWRAERNLDIIPFAIGFNKLFLCTRKWQDFYRTAVIGDPITRHFYVKNTSLEGDSLPTFDQKLLPEHNYRQRLGSYLKLYVPQSYVYLKALQNSRRHED